MQVELDLETATPQAVLDWAYRSHQRVALVASFQVESAVLIDMASKLTRRPWVITLDTGRLPAQTHDYIETIRRRYDLDLHLQHPDAAQVSALVDQHGPNLFRESVDLRHRCCEVRKVLPLREALKDAGAWITGLRRDQTSTRAATPVVATDHGHGGIPKIAPLARWTREDVQRYVEEHRLDLHPLYAEGYTSIGCAPCTRATLPGEDERAGRWWWENAEDGVKECGLHWSRGE